MRGLGALALVVTGWALAVIAVKFPTASFLTFVGVVLAGGGSASGLAHFGLWERWGWRTGSTIVLGVALFGPVLGDTLLH